MMIFFDEIKCSKFFHWHVECSFDNSAERFSAKGQKFTAQCPKTNRSFFSESYLIKIFLWTRKTVSWQPNRVFFSTKSWKNSSQCPKVRNFFRKKKQIISNFSFWLLDFSFDDSTGKFLTESHSFLFNTEIGKIVFSKKNQFSSR